MLIVGPSDVVLDLVASVGLGRGQEAYRAEVAESGFDRGLLRVGQPRPIFTRALEAELVGDIGPEKAIEFGHSSVSLVFLTSVIAHGAICRRKDCNTSGIGVVSAVVAV